MSHPESLQNLGTCPSCGGADVNAIWYGMPTLDYKDHWPPNVRVGGCSIMEDSPNRACLKCGHEWVSSNDVHD